jgi:ABC-type dipeptide/oligopeptide/nickel transport system permease component
MIYKRPVRQLIGERALVTVRSVAAGLALGWGLAILFASASAFGRGSPTLLLGMTMSGVLLSIPSAVLATVCLLLQVPPAIAIAAVVLPRVFPYIHEQLWDSWATSYVLMARAKGLRIWRVFIFHVIPPTLLPILALAGVSVTLAFGASIPIEALSDSPGIGQLAWRAALGRDLPVLVTITLLLTAITVIVNALADLMSARLGHKTA